MKLRHIAALAAAVSLSACTDADWSQTMSFVGVDDTSQAEPAPRPVARVAAAPAAPARTTQVAGANPFCASVAKNDSERNDFDAATQQGVFVRSYQQCVTIFGGVTPE